MASAITKQLEKRYLAEDDPLALAALKAIRELRDALAAMVVDPVAGLPAARNALKRHH